MAVNFATPTKAAKPFIFDIDFEFEDTFTCGTPVWVHVTGRIIERFGEDHYTLIQPLKTQYTNLENGKTVLTQVAGPITGFFDGGFIYTGVVLVKRGPGQGAWVDAGIVETVLEYDPHTGEFVESVVRSVGHHPGDINDAICAALQ